MAETTVVGRAVIGPDGVERGARLSDDRAYRWVLWRDWDGFANMRSLVVIGLNPSTADETVDDPTIRRCVGFAKREGCGRLVMLNLFALRATDPRTMKAHPSPIGDENDATIRHWCTSTMGDTPVVVAAWGVHGAHLNRDAAVREMFSGLLCFGTTKDGHPRHPLYLAADTPLVPFGDRAMDCAGGAAFDGDPSRVVLGVS